VHFDPEQFAGLVVERFGDVGEVHLAPPEPEQARRGRPVQLAVGADVVSEVADQLLARNHEIVGYRPGVVGEPEAGEHEL